jgi:hypothetical protein
MDVYALTNASGETLSKDEINDLLKEIGVSDEAIKEGTEDAIEEDAQSSGINLNQLGDIAKKEDVSGSSNKAKEDYDAQLKLLGIPDNVAQEGDVAVQEYASKNHITLPEATGTQLNINS